MTDEREDLVEDEAGEVAAEDISYEELTEDAADDLVENVEEEEAYSEMETSSEVEASEEDSAEPAPVAPKRVQPRLPSPSSRGKMQTGGRGAVAPGTFLKKPGTGTVLKKPAAVGTAPKKPMPSGLKKPAPTGLKKPAPVAGKKPMPAGSSAMPTGQPIPVKSGKCLWASALIFWIFLLTAVSAAVLVLTALGKGEMLASATKIAEGIPLGDMSKITEAQTVAVDADKNLQQLKATLSSAQQFVESNETDPMAEPATDQPSTETTDMDIDSSDDLDSMQSTEPVAEPMPSEDMSPTDDLNMDSSGIDSTEVLEPISDFDTNDKLDSTDNLDLDVESIM